jgi:hypothetical protein
LPDDYSSRARSSKSALLANAELMAAADTDDIEPPLVDATDAAHPALPEPAAEQPSYYWTCRVLAAGFTLDECAQIRSLAPEVVFDHVVRAAEAGLEVEMGWLISPEKARQFEAVIGPRAPERIRPLLARLPRGTRYEEVQFYLKCRTQCGASS